MADGRNLPVPVTPRGRGQPTNYTEEIAEEILERIAMGESLIQICRDARMPGESTVRGWVIDDRPPGFSARYARARIMQADRNVEEIEDIARNQQLGVTVKRKKFLNDDGQVIVSQEESIGDMVQHRTLLIGTLQWKASKVNWRDYGQKAALPAPEGDSGDSQGEQVNVEGGLPDDQP